ncbi:MAG: ribonuclease P protein component [Candidatus Kerfeldbacteria bacterium]|nr:ribonuclease P protein component [Candidatus Kerfeldbacteria bacterium]
MLPAKFRLRRPSEFEHVYALARPVHSSFFSLRLAKNNVAPLTTRIGIVVSGKIIRKAQERNTLKRRVRAILADEMPSIASGFDVILSVKREARVASPLELTRNLQSLLQRARLL